MAQSLEYVLDSLPPLKRIRIKRCKRSKYLWIGLNFRMGVEPRHEFRASRSSFEYDGEEERKVAGFHC
jgi:hypothetical protein